MPPVTYKCAKCDSPRYETGEIRAAGGFWTKIFDIQSETFVTVSCAECGYTELYKGDKNTLSNILDWFTG